MSKLKIKLEVVNKTLIYAVLNQCESITCIDGERPLYFKSGNGIEVRSERIPMLKYKEIHLRGEYKGYYEERLDITEYSTNGDAVETKKLYLDALIEWVNSDSVSGRKYNLLDNIYEF